MIQVAGYGRMSTDKQQLSPKIQEDMIRAWYEQQMRSGRWDDTPHEFIGFFCDEAVTSKIDMLDRPVGQWLFPTLNRGDMIVCAKYNRAFRSAADSERTLDRCNEAGINLVFLDLNIDTSTPNGRLMAGVMAAVSRHERDMRSETTRDAKATLKKRGRPVGRDSPVGWKLKPKTAHSIARHVPDLKARQVATLCYRGYREAYMQGMTDQQADVHTKMLVTRHLGADATTYRAHPMRYRGLHCALRYPLCTRQEIADCLGIENMRVMLPLVWFSYSSKQYEAFRQIINEEILDERLRLLHLADPGFADTSGE